MDIFTSEIKEELIAFIQSLVRIKSYSGQEEQIIRFIGQKMQELGYDEVRIDSMGNVIGRIGQGGTSILFDSHVDTVEVNDEKEWKFPPFSGEIVDGRLYGSGSVDMKSSVAATIYAGAMVKKRVKEAEKKAIKTVTVAYEDFSRLDIRVGRVLTAEKVPKSNKLLKLKVDIGDEVRQIVAGMAQFTSPEEISGKLVVMVANLQVAKIFGIESSGMILAAGDEASLLIPEKDVPPGTKIR